MFCFAVSAIIAAVIVMQTGPLPDGDESVRKEVQQMGKICIDITHIILL